MRVALLYDRVPEEGATLDQEDVLVQARAISAALRELGHEPFPLSTTLDLSDLRERLESLAPSLVFNLVESLGGRGSLIHLPPALLDSMGIPYTGAGTEALYVTTNKMATKRVLLGASIPAPQGFSDKELTKGARFQSNTFILKSVWEHASIGLNEDSVVTTGSAERLLSIIERRQIELGGAFFAETYIEGREFNLSLLASDAGPQVLPPAEIRFEGFPDTKRRIVGYRAKWVEDSFEYLHTVRSFEFPKSDRVLLQSLTGLARRCWDLFELRGYGRVDFRVDSEGRPWVLEVNANPCLSPDAGFAAASREAGLAYTEVIRRIIADSH
jgi:D-alanine-D-alanine ligase